jgi:hypothetical protein
MPLMMDSSLVDSLDWSGDAKSTSTAVVFLPQHVDMVWTGDNSFFSQAGLQNLLLLRVLRLSRVLTDMTTFGRFTAALGVGTLNNSHGNTQVDRARLKLGYKCCISQTWVPCFMVKWPLTKTLVLGKLGV